MSTSSPTRALFFTLSGLPDATRNYIFDQFPKGSSQPCEWYLNYADEDFAVINENATMRSLNPAELPTTLADVRRFFKRAKRGEIDWEIVVLQQCERQGQEQKNSDDDEEYNPELTILSSRRLADIEIGQRLAEKFPYREQNVDHDNDDNDDDDDEDDDDEDDDDFDDDDEMPCARSDRWQELNSKVFLRLAESLASIETSLARLVRTYCEKRESKNTTDDTNVARTTVSDAQTTVLDNLLSFDSQDPCPIAIRVDNQ